MIFLIIFIISISTILTLYIISKSNKSLLLCVRESCSIDSVRFEKRFKYLTSFTRKVSVKISIYIRKFLFHFVKQRDKTLHEIKKMIRKKLFVNKQKEQVSEYISEMKK